MELPKPPEDQELRNIIDKLAQFVARNGHEFEQMTKNKQKGNPKFSFLFGGEFFNYYNYKVTTEQAIIKQRKQVDPTIQAVIERQQKVASMQEQINNSEKNLLAQHNALMIQQQSQIDAALFSALEEQLSIAAQECALNLHDFDRLLQPIVDNCTKDSISAGKQWIFQNGSSPAHCDVIARFLVREITASGTEFEAKLHLIYLIGDLLHHCIRKHNDAILKALTDVVVPVFCNASVGTNDQQQEKLAKLLKLWETNNYFDAEILAELKNPTMGLSNYQTGLMAKYSQVVTPITQQTQHQYVGLQQQHNEFVGYIGSQIKQLQQPQIAPPPMEPQLPPGMPVPFGGIPYDGPPHLRPPMNFNSPQMFNPMQGQLGPGNFNHGGMVPIEPQLGPGPPPPFINPGCGPPVGFNQLPPPPPPPATGMSSQGEESDSPRHNAFNPADYAFPSGPPEGPPIDMNDPTLIPSVAYFDLPAGLMVPLVKPSDCSYKPLCADDLRLPPPAPPSERLLTAIEMYYSAPSHDRPRNSEGWEQLGLYEYYKAKNEAKRKKEVDILAGRREPSPPVIVDSAPSFSGNNNSGQKRRFSEVPLHQVRRTPPRRKREGSPEARRRRSRTRSRSVSPRRRRRSVSQSPPRRRSRGRSRSMTPPSHSGTDRRRSLTPPSFIGTDAPSLDRKLDESNKGHQMLLKMGWGGAGLGANERGIQDPINAGDVRDRVDMYKGVGVSMNDPFENFRKNRGQAFITRMRSRAEERDRIGGNPD